MSIIKSIRVAIEDNGPYDAGPDALDPLGVELDPLGVDPPFLV